MATISTAADGKTWLTCIKRSDRLEVGECCPRQVYVELQIPKLSRSVRKVTIYTLSHDQGWSDNQDRYGGTYENSYTFFDLAVITPMCHERIWSFTFQKNMHASSVPHRHENVWDTESSDEAGSAWLQSVQGGDTVQVFPMAMLQLWTNYVYEVEIVVEGDFEIPETSLASEAAYGSMIEKPSFYRPLQESRRQTRLLSLHAGTFEEPIICSIMTVSLDDAGHDKYDALSYCWGDTHVDKIIQLQSTTHIPGNETPTYEIPITLNLYEALRHLRPENGLPRMLWVDAVCIDQENFGERSQQVALMPIIYAEAARVVVWLGVNTGSPVRRECFSALQAIQERLQIRQGTSVTYASQELEQQEADVINAAIPNMVDYTIQWNLCDFDWFKRTWVLQEISNARTATFRCGFDEVAWPVVSSVIRLLQAEKLGSALVQAASQPANVLRSAIVPSIWFSILRLGSDNQVPRVEASSDGILEILIKAHSLKATDLRDKLFALLQFGKETRDVAKLPAIISVDYSKPTIDVFTDFVRWWICTHRSLRILSAVHTLKGRGWQKMGYVEPPGLGALEYPSWCFWPVGDDRIANATLGLAMEAPYRAGGSTVPDIELINSPRVAINPRILQVGGYRLCSIAHIAPLPFWALPDEPNELKDAFMRVFDPASYRRFVMPDQNGQDMAKLNEGIQEFLARHYTYHTRGFKGRIPYVPCLSPCYFATNDPNDERHGLCPHNARAGDIIVMLCGGPVLYLLREANSEGEDEKGSMETAMKDRRFNFVGECFLQGYMNGKMLIDVEEKGLEREIFNLM
ncbi:heterokaryon incompatibility protein-domain-containing protein [Hypoxylon crocopeplum]|nr:heterokaryon incompatibility protein-domain-containing protein [Hypoxylon crocopeplum]